MNAYRTQSPSGYDNKKAPDLTDKIQALIRNAKEVGQIPSAIDGGAMLSHKHRTVTECKFCEILAKSAFRMAKQSSDPDWTLVGRVFRTLSTGGTYATK